MNEQTNERMDKQTFSSIAALYKNSETEDSVKLCSSDMVRQFTNKKFTPLICDS